MGGMDEKEAEALEALLVLAFLGDPGSDPPAGTRARPDVPSQGGEGVDPAGQVGGIGGPERRRAGIRRAA